MTQRSGTGSSHSEELLSALVSRPMGFLVISILFPASFTGASFDSRSVSLRTQSPETPGELLEVQMLTRPWSVELRASPAAWLSEILQ